MCGLAFGLVWVGLGWGSGPQDLVVLGLFLRARASSSGGSSIYSGWDCVRGGMWGFPTERTIPMTISPGPP